jgi:ribosomal protein L7/L12
MDDARLAQRFGAIELQLQRISEHLGIDCPAFVGAASAPAGGDAPPPPGLPAEVVELARAGHSTQAISKLRELTGASLLEAKRAVDAL